MPRTMIIQLFFVNCEHSRNVSKAKDYQHDAEDLKEEIWNENFAEDA